MPQINETASTRRRQDRRRALENHRPTACWPPSAAICARLAPAASPSRGLRRTPGCGSPARSPSTAGRSGPAHHLGAPPAGSFGRCRTPNGPYHSAHAWIMGTPPRKEAALRSLHTPGCRPRPRLSSSARKRAAPDGRWRRVSAGSRRSRSNRPGPALGAVQRLGNSVAGSSRKENGAGPPRSAWRQSGGGPLHLMGCSWCRLGDGGLRGGGRLLGAASGGGGGRCRRSGWVAG